MQATEVRKAITTECDQVKSLLLSKNREYGNSALEPIGIFSGQTAIEQLKVRIDDKLKRIQTIRSLDDVLISEDTEQDLIGYLILLRVARALAKAEVKPEKGPATGPAWEATTGSMKGQRYD